LGAPSTSWIEATARDGTPLAAEVRGTGPSTVVLVPGAGADHYALLPQARFFAQEGFRAVTLDPRGSGRSGKPTTGYDIDTLAADLQAVIEALGVPRVHLFGHSLGSVTALLAAARHPERILSVAAASPWAYVDPYLRLLFSLTAELVHSFAPEEYGPWLLTFLASREYLAEPERAAGMVRSMFLGTRALPPDFLERHLRAGHGLDLRPVLPRLAVPALILYAEGDRMIPPSYSREVAELIPGAETAVYEGAGASHLFHFERAAEVNSRLVAFFRRHDRP
jgi:pimeloyl-ACP methyl ester carboxylesterase